MNGVWHKKRLGSLALKITDGSHNPPKGGPESEYLMLSSKNVFDDDLHYAEPRYLTAEQFGQEDRRTGIVPGDVLLTIVGTVGRSAVVPTNAPRITLQRSVAVIRPQQQLVESRFLMYSFIEQNAELNERARGVAQKGIYLETLKEFEIVLPPLPEQRQIVGILDEAFEGIATAKANAEKNLQNARAVFESHLQSVFTQRGDGWVEKRLGDLSRINYGYTESASAEKVGPHFLRITDIQDNRVDWASVPYCPIDKTDYPKYKLVDGDIVFARTGATTGKSYLVIDPPQAVFASYLIRLQLSDKELLPKFVNLFFRTHSFWETIRSGVSGSAQGGFNATKLGEIVIPFPKSTNEQQAIVAKLDTLTEETQHLESIYRRKVDALEALKKSLLHQAFSGDLTASERLQERVA